MNNLTSCAICGPVCITACISVSHVFVYADHTLVLSGPHAPVRALRWGRHPQTLGYMGTTLSQTRLRSPPYPDVF